MKKIRYLHLGLGLVFLMGCTPNTHENKIPVESKKIHSAVGHIKSGKTTGPISLSYRKLTLTEISQHVSMDEENTKAHLRSTNIHGYYSLIAKNYPPGIEFVLYQVDMSNNIHPTKTYLVTENGNLVTKLDNLYIDLENSFVFFSNYLPGEPVDFVLSSKDGKYQAATRIIPNPIVVEDAEHRTISVQIDNPDRRHYLIYAAGLEPFANYTMTTTFESEKFVHCVSATQNGEIFQSSGPTVPWVRGGEGSVELRGNELTRPISLNFKWGF